MDENETEGTQSGKSRSSSKLLWLVVLIAIAVLWWWYRQPPNEDVARAQLEADRAAAVTDPDDILVDLKDDASPAAIEQALGIDLVLVDDSGVAQATRLYRAHVDPAARDAILATLATRSDVEIAEPDYHMTL